MCFSCNFIGTIIVWLSVGAADGGDMKVDTIEDVAFSLFSYKWTVDALVEVSECTIFWVCSVNQIACTLTTHDNVNWKWVVLTPDLVGAKMYVDNLSLKFIWVKFCDTYYFFQKTICRAASELFVRSMLSSQEHENDFQFVLVCIYLNEYTLVRSQIQILTCFTSMMLLKSTLSVPNTGFSRELSQTEC